MRILLLTVDFPPAAGGIQNLLAQAADALSADHHVTVVAPRRAGDREWDGARRYGVTRARCTGGWPLSMVWFLLAALGRLVKRPPDVVLCGHVLLGPACWAIARIAGVPLVVIAHAYEIRTPRMRRLAGWTLRRAAAVVSVSEFTRRSVLDHGVAPDRAVVIHPGAASRPPVGELARAGGSDRIILTVARLKEPYKGHDMMIRALPLVLAREPRARYVIVGDGPRRPYLERLADSLGVSAAVTVAGEVSSAQLDEWYRRCDLFALLSREDPYDGGAEGYGLAFIEAGAWGKPVVGGNSGGIPDAIVDGVTGLLVEPTDIAAIADAVVRVLGDAALAQSFGAHGHDRAVHELSWRNFAGALAAVLEASRSRGAIVTPARSAQP